MPTRHLIITDRNLDDPIFDTQAHSVASPATVSSESLFDYSSVVIDLNGIAAAPEWLDFDYLTALAKLGIRCQVLFSTGVSRRLLASCLPEGVTYIAVTKPAAVQQVRHQYPAHDWLQTEPCSIAFVSESTERLRAIALIPHGEASTSFAFGRHLYYIQASLATFMPKLDSRRHSNSTPQTASARRTLLMLAVLLVAQLALFFAVKTLRRQQIRRNGNISQQVTVTASSAHSKTVAARRQWARRTSIYQQASKDPVAIKAEAQRIIKTADADQIRAFLDSQWIHGRRNLEEYFHKHAWSSESAEDLAPLLVDWTLGSHYERTLYSLRNRDLNDCSWRTGLVIDLTEHPAMYPSFLEYFQAGNFPGKEWNRMISAMRKLDAISSQPSLALAAQGFIDAIAAAIDGDSADFAPFNVAPELQFAKDYLVASAEARSTRDVSSRMGLWQDYLVLHSSSPFAAEADYNYLIARLENERLPHHEGITQPPQHKQTTRLVQGFGAKWGKVHYLYDDLLWQDIVSQACWRNQHECARLIHSIVTETDRDGLWNLAGRLEGDWTPRTLRLEIPAGDSRPVRDARAGSPSGPSTGAAPIARTTEGDPVPEAPPCPTAFAVANQLIDQFGYTEAHQPGTPDPDPESAQDT